MATSRQPRGPDIPPLEWAAALVGFVLVSGALGMMVWLGLARSDSPADISLRVEAVAPIRGGHVVTISAVNRGGITAANVTVEGELRSASGVTETSTMTFSYLAPNSERRGGLYFEKDPRKFELKLRPKGYETP